jgi:ferredoxin
MYRNRKVLDAAKNMACHSCGAWDGTVVMAHSNQQKHGKGMGIKAHDCFIAALCDSCHAIVDGRQLPNISQKGREKIWSMAHQVTVATLLSCQMWDQEALMLLKEAGSL